LLHILEIRVLAVFGCFHKETKNEDRKRRTGKGERALFSTGKYFVAIAV